MANDFSDLFDGEDLGSPISALDVETGEVRDSGLVAAPLEVSIEQHKSMMGMVDALENAKATIKINPTYLEFNAPKQKIKAFFQGFQTVTKNDPSGKKDIRCASLLTKDGVFINGSTSLVQQLENIPQGTPIEIEYIGTEKTANGFNVKKYDVRLLQL